MKCDDCIHNIQRVNGKLDCECKLDPRVPWVMNEKTNCCLYKKAEQILYNCRCFRCSKPLGEFPVGILMMYPARKEDQKPLYTIPRMYCNDCLDSFYKWANGEETKEVKE